MPHAHAFLSAPTLDARPRRVLVTGAAGHIGTAFARLAPERFELRLMVRPGETVSEPRGEVVETDLGDLPSLKAACAGIDTVLHLAGIANAAAPWGPLLEANVVGTYHLFAAAKAARCRRVVYASSIHAVSGYPTDVQVGPADPVNPGDLYGVTKCFGEALARYMAEQEGLGAICVRIGAFQGHGFARHPKSVRMMDAWVSERDLVQLLVRCVDDEALRFAVVNGLSDNRFSRLDLTSARELLGYAPEDSFSRENPDVPDLTDRIAHHSLKDGYPSGLRDDL